MGANDALQGVLASLQGVLAAKGLGDIGTKHVD
eukprot:CAMPEP_0114644062 /NCGR_PEP_ID=MMETSP0191-20121206/3757_1 /TAXON_ID=126664 /ORGANISM="Sorites sp." /LENGTH=32 /DNA_ID= /DNA_START= /DNA_END= /DNA_ORIENTATION=